METIQLQCGHCRKVMAISVEHLGGQVQCPHCQGVVQTPSPSPPPVAAVAAIASMELHQPESIFAGPESSDSVIGEPASPKVEMPSVPPAAQSGAESDAQLTAFRPRPIYTKSVFAMYALIFLVPYAVLTTLAILYLVFNQTSRHPFDMIRDPIPDAKKGGARRAMMDTSMPLAAHQRVGLGRQLQIGKDGDLLVTPERVVLTEEGDLRLFLRAKNTSTDTTFEPCNEFFVKYDPQKNTPSYTFLQSKSHHLGNVFGAYLGYRKKADDADAGGAILGPGQETLIVLTTYESDRPRLKEISKGNDSQLWRIELRRGLVKYASKDVSTTTVIGVEFNSSEIGKESKKS